MVQKYLFLLWSFALICSSVVALPSHISNNQLANTTNAWQEEVVKDRTTGIWYRRNNANLPWKNYDTGQYELLSDTHLFQSYIRYSDGKDSLLVPTTFDIGCYVTSEQHTIGSMLLDYLALQHIDPSKVGIYYINLTTGEEFSHNGEQLFVAGSTWKLGLGVAIEDYMRKGKVNKNTGLYYDESYAHIGGTQWINGYYEYNTYIPLSRCMYLMLVPSGNTSAALLWTKLNQLSGNNLQYYRDLVDAGEVEYERNGNNVTPKFQAYVMKKLYEEKENYPYVYELLSQAYRTTYGNMYVCDPKVIHKCGFYNGHINDVILNYGEHPYVLSIYTDHIENPKEVIGMMNSLVYNWHTRTIPQPTGFARFRWFANFHHTSYLS